MFCVPTWAVSKSWADESVSSETLHSQRKNARALPFKTGLSGYVFSRYPDVVNLTEKVKAAIDRNELIPSGARVLAGVSGGADSVALLHVLNRLGVPLIAVHLNHSIRGAAADADEAFVIDLCERLGVDWIAKKVDVPALAQTNGLSLEVAARQARHNVFKAVLSGLCPSSAVLCLAHHADDQLETFFLRAARGAGLTGLGGMRFFQDLEGMPVCRPMLGIRRTDIIDWLRREGLEWREDASNLDENIPRNFVRHQLLPNLGKLNVRAAENILRSMEILRDEEDDPHKAARRRAARDWLIEHGVTPSFDAVEQFVEFSDQATGTQYLDLEGLRVVNEYGVLKAEQASLRSSGRTVQMAEGAGILRGKWQASVSLKKVAGREVVVRVPRPGDRMNPYGMEGSKKLQDIFTDQKIPRAQRADWPVVTCGDEIIWLPGYRIARGWELPAGQESALHLFANDEG